EPGHVLMESPAPGVTGVHGTRGDPVASSPVPMFPPSFASTPAPPDDVELLPQCVNTPTAAVPHTIAAAPRNLRMIPPVSSSGTRAEIPQVVAGRRRRAGADQPARRTARGRATTRSAMPATTSASARLKTGQ